MSAFTSTLYHVLIYWVGTSIQIHHTKHVQERKVGQYWNTCNFFIQTCISSDFCTSSNDRNLEVIAINILLQLAFHKDINQLCINKWTLCVVCVVALLGVNAKIWLTLWNALLIDLWAKYTSEIVCFCAQYLTVFCSSSIGFTFYFFSIVRNCINMPNANHFHFILVKIFMSCVITKSLSKRSYLISIIISYQHNEWNSVLLPKHFVSTFSIAVDGSRKQETCIFSILKPAYMKLQKCIAHS